MGRIRTLQIKNLGERLSERFPDRFTNDFDKNKKIIDELMSLESKKNRNKLAGYITHTIENKKNPKSFEISYQQKEDKRRRGRRR